MARKPKGWYRRYEIVRRSVKFHPDRPARDRWCVMGRNLYQRDRAGVQSARFTPHLCRLLCYHQGSRSAPTLHERYWKQCAANNSKSTWITRVTWATATP